MVTPDGRLSLTDRVMRSESGLLKSWRTAPSGASDFGRR
jgi:hypothetical protein